MVKGIASLKYLSVSRYRVCNVSRCRRGPKARKDRGNDVIVIMVDMAMPNAKQVVNVVTCWTLGANSQYK